MLTDRFSRKLPYHNQLKVLVSYVKTKFQSKTDRPPQNQS